MFPSTLWPWLCSNNVFTVAMSTFPHQLPLVKSWSELFYYVISLRKVWIYLIVPLREPLKVLCRFPFWTPLKANNTYLSNEPLKKPQKTLFFMSVCLHHSRQDFCCRQQPSRKKKIGISFDFVFTFMMKFFIKVNWSNKSFFFMYTSSLIG